MLSLVFVELSVSLLFTFFELMSDKSGTRTEEFLSVNIRAQIDFLSKAVKRS